jgi:hypothetical protein
MMQALFSISFFILLLNIHLRALHVIKIMYCNNNKITPKCLKERRLNLPDRKVPKTESVGFYVPFIPFFLSFLFISSKSQRVSRVCSLNLFSYFHILAHFFPVYSFQFLLMLCSVCLPVFPLLSDFM